MNGAIPALGLDLGTTFSVVAQVSRGGVPTSLPTLRVLHDAVGGALRWRSGHRRRDRTRGVGDGPEYVVQLVKRRMGSEWIFEYHGVTLHAEHVTALIVKKLLQDAQMLAGAVNQAA